METENHLPKWLTELITKIRTGWMRLFSFLRNDIGLLRQQTELHHQEEMESLTNANLSLSKDIHELQNTIAEIREQSLCQLDMQIKQNEALQRLSAAITQLENVVQTENKEFSDDMKEIKELLKMIAVNDLLDSIQIPAK